MGFSVLRLPRPPSSCQCLRLPLPWTRTWTWWRWTWIIPSVLPSSETLLERCKLSFLLLKINPLGNGSNHDVVLLFSLFGITTLQAFIYFNGNPQDRLPFKLLVRKTLQVVFHLRMFMLTRKFSKRLVFCGSSYFLFDAASGSPSFLLFWDWRLRIYSILDTTQIAFMTEGVYSYVILNFMNPGVLLNIPW